MIVVLSKARKNKMKIAGLQSSHDCSFVVLEDGIPLIHAELERYIRMKEPKGDAFEFLKDNYEDYESISYFSRPYDVWRGGPGAWYPDSTAEMNKISKSNGGSLLTVGHHKCHAANAFYSSNFEDALIVTIDGGGWESVNGKPYPATMTIWEGQGLELKPIKMFAEHDFNVGTMWADCTEFIFGLSRGYPKGNQCGTVMALACMGDSEKYYNDFYNHKFKRHGFNYSKFKNIASQSEEEMFNVASSLQKATEDFLKKVLEPYVNQTKSKNLCLSGGVVLNSVMTGKMVQEWYKDKFENFYTCPVPYDAGTAIGAAQYIWHSVLNKERINWEDNFTPFLGKTYNKQDVLDSINELGVSKKEGVSIQEVVDILSNNKIVSVFNEGSESGRRALGNRSILANPCNPEMKDIINEKVKHRQWFRPFAPSMLRHKMSEWFVTDMDSPYMNYVLKFKDESKDKVPAVVHYDGTGRVQTVTEKDNKWFYDLLSCWEKKSGVPILLNTSFNDREPIVENPSHAINCFLGTDIDYLYFPQFQILVSKNDK